MIERDPSKRRSRPVKTALGTGGCRRWSLRPLDTCGGGKRGRRPKAEVARSKRGRRRLAFSEGRLPPVATRD
eukprot:scaffold1466_cov249-Pinguiococcus_pyrenoidosus.AAC.12